MQIGCASYPWVGFGGEATHSWVPPPTGDEYSKSMGFGPKLTVLVVLRATKYSKITSLLQPCAKSFYRMTTLSVYYS
jgi:hypothetical protein